MRQVPAANQARAIVREYCIARDLLRFALIRVVRIRKRLIVAKRSSIQSEYVSSRLLVFQLIEEGIRHINALIASTGLVAATLGYLSRPEIKAALVRQATKKIVIMIPH